MTQKPDARIYVASRASLDARPAMWREFRDCGWPIISTWIDEAQAGQTECLTELWSRIEREVTTATAVVFYAEADDFPLKGAYIEIGMAMAAGVPIYVVAPGVPMEPPSYRPIGSWLCHPGVRVYPTVLAALSEATYGRHASPSPEGTRERGELTADFVRALPGGKLDDSQYEEIETALDRADAPCQAADGRWLTLAERVAALTLPPVPGVDRDVVDLIERTARWMEATIPRISDQDLRDDAARDADALRALVSPLEGKGEGSSGGRVQAAPSGATEAQHSAEQYEALGRACERHGLAGFADNGEMLFRAPDEVIEEQATAPLWEQIAVLKRERDEAIAAMSRMCGDA